MNILQTQIPVADYCNLFEASEISVNREYQRSDKVWPDIARSFLIETILMGFPIPKMFLHQITDIKTKKTIKEIVDGQQRSTAIFDFFRGALRLTRSLELDDARGRTFDELSDELKSEFLSYGLTVDIIVGSTHDDVREVFRRMNLYTVPLNPEEQRHARFQGLFKWFIHRLARALDEAFVKTGVFTQKELVRMQDTKLLTEISHALIYGISTTSKAKLDGLYNSREKDFVEQDGMERQLLAAWDRIVEWGPLHEGTLMKPLQLYSLVLAVIHVQDRIPTLAQWFDPAGRAFASNSVVVANLSELADAADRDDRAGLYREFVDASSEKTNVLKERATRFKWFCRALTDTM